jgi:hypothetical protein
MPKESDEIEKMALAIDDLIYMDIVKLVSTKTAEKTKFSPQFSIIVSNVINDMKIKQEDDSDNQLMKLMYYCLLIYMNEYLKLPKQLTMAFGNDLEKHQDQMQCRELITRYVSVLKTIFVNQKKEANMN